MIVKPRERTHRRRSFLLLVHLFALCGAAAVVRSPVCADGPDAATEFSKLESPVIDPGFEALLKRHPDLCRGGAEAISKNKNWIAISVGRVALKTEDGQPLSNSDATKIARVKAHRDLAKLLHGFRMTAQDKSVIKSAERDGRSEIIELFRSTSQQTVEATLTRVEVVGTWRLDAGESIAVMVAVGDPQHPLFDRHAAGQPLAKLRNEHWQGDWKSVFATRPAILSGGASVYRKADAVWILAVGKARLKGDPIMDRRRELAASTNAAREAVQLVNGLKISNQSTATQEFRRLTADETTLASEVSETLEKTGSEKLVEPIRLSHPVATWESSDGQFYFQAMAFKLSDLK